jgi:putative transposase
MESMKKSRFNEEQVVGILSQADAGKKVEDICRENKISTYTFYKWRRRYGGMGTSEAKRFKELEVENARLKKLVANQALDMIILKDALGKKW